MYVSVCLRGYKNLDHKRTLTEATFGLRQYGQSNYITTRCKRAKIVSRSHFYSVIMIKNRLGDIIGR